MANVFTFVYGTNVRTHTLFIPPPDSGGGFALCVRHFCSFRRRCGLKSIFFCIRNSGQKPCLGGCRS